MEKDRSLDEFLGGRGTTEDSEPSIDGVGEPAESDEFDESDVTLAETDPDETGPEADESNADSATAAVAPATPTYRWVPNGEACTICGGTVDRGWFDDGRFVCSDCKEW